MAIYFDHENHCRKCNHDWTSSCFVDTCPQCESEDVLSMNLHSGEFILGATAPDLDEYMRKNPPPKKCGGEGSKE